jgi:GTP cyclohydrolase I
MTIEDRNEAVPTQRIDMSANALPDVADHPNAANADRLDWVGMDAIDLPILLPDDAGASVRVPARVGAFVDLAADETRGIHMSRLYLLLDQRLATEPLTPGLLRELLDAFLASHAALSRRARLQVSFDHFVRRPALASGNSGWRRYPVSVTATLERNAFTLGIAFDVVYSSTCPASAALARQLVADDFGQAFPAGISLDRMAVQRWLASEQGMRATPHSQRSIAAMTLRLDPTLAALPVTALIDCAEAALGTPVQAAVKRIDEQAFTRRNGENLMFCEDAARRLQLAFDADPVVRDFHLRVTHRESLHAHDAVAEASKGTARASRDGD